MAGVLTANTDDNVGFANQSCKLYAISSLPVGLQWGTSFGSSGDTTRYMCEQNKAVRIWIPAEVRVAAFTKDDIPLHRVSLCFQPLLQSDRMKIVELQDRLAFPARSNSLVIAVLLTPTAVRIPERGRHYQNWVVGYQIYGTTQCSG